MSEILPNVLVGGALVMEVVEACALADRPLALPELSRYCTSSDRATREAAKAGVWLGLVDLRDGMYTASAVAKESPPRSSEAKVLLFRQALQKKRSFVQFLALLDYNNSPSAAAEKVRVLYQIGCDPVLLVKLFGGWGKAAGILEELPGGLQLRAEYHVAELPFDYLDGLKEALDDDIRARIFVSKKLSAETFHFVSDAGVERAVKALRAVKSDPRNSVEDIGEFFEDYLRLKSTSAGLPTSDANGIGGVLQVLSQSSQLASEHRILGEALNTLRIMASHPTRAKTGLRWVIRQDSGLDAVLLTMSVIRSIHERSLTDSAVF